MNLIDDIIHIGKTYGWGLALTVITGAILAWIFRIGTYNAVRALGQAVEGMSTVNREQDRLRQGTTDQNRQLRAELRNVHRENGRLKAEVKDLQRKVAELERVVRRVQQQ